MTLHAALRLMAGSVLLISLLLGHWADPWWYVLTAFVGLNLLQSAFTNWCPAITLFRRLGLPEERCDQGMSVHQGVHLIIGASVLLILALVFLFQLPATLLLVIALLALSLVQSAFSGWCPALWLARILGFKPPAANQ